MERVIVGSLLPGAVALLSMLIGGVLMVLLVISFNKAVDKKEASEKKPIRVVNLKKPEKQVPKRVTPDTTPKTTTRTPPRVQPPDLSVILGGIAMNIPEFAATDIAGDSTELLDDITADTVMTEDTVDSKPQVTYRAAIDYPQSAAKNGGQGYVVVHLLIAKDGSIQLAKVLDSEPRGLFDQTVLTGIQNWRFSPAKFNGEPVQVWVKQKVSFNT